MGKRKRTGLLRWFRNQKLWKKILYAFIISAIVPLAVVQGFMAHMNSTSMKAKLDELMINELVQMAERVNLTLNVYTSLLYQIYIDNQIIENINVCWMIPARNRKRQEEKFMTGSGSMIYRQRELSVSVLS